MKIILTGATGFVGSEVLAQLFADPAVERVTCLSRRVIEIENPKLRTILHRDFSIFGEEIFERLDDCSACIWALGGKASDLGQPDVLLRVTYDYTLAFAQKLAPRQRQPFAFCYLSGMGADPTETAWFPWEKRTRHLKGRTERDLLALGDQHPHFNVHCFRPGGILPLGSSPVVHRLLAPVVIGVDRLARSLTTVAKERRFDGNAAVIGNRAIKRLSL